MRIFTSLFFSLFAVVAYAQQNVMDDVSRDMAMFREQHGEPVADDYGNVYLRTEISLNDDGGVFIGRNLGYFRTKWKNEQGTGNSIVTIFTDEDNFPPYN